MHATDKSDGTGQILDAAEELIRATSAEGWSLGDLAERAGVPLDGRPGRVRLGVGGVHRSDPAGRGRLEAAIREAPYDNATDRIMHLLQACVPDYDWTFWIELWSLALRDERASALREELDQNFRA